jgi:hypothetical protein
MRYLVICQREPADGLTVRAGLVRRLESEPSGPLVAEARRLLSSRLTDDVLRLARASFEGD